MPLFALAFLVIARAEAAPSFDEELRAGHFPQASALLSQMPPDGRGESVEKMLAVLPLLSWSAETAPLWADCMTAIETESNSYWATRNLGDLLGALAAPNVPRNAAVAALFDRIIAASKRWAGQGAPLVVAKGLLWAGDFDRAFSAYPAGATPEPLVEFALETLADKPELGREDALWKMALARMGDDPLAREKAVHALAFSGRLNQALAIAARQTDPGERVGEEILSTRYSRYGGHEDDFTQAMSVAANGLSSLPKTASSLPALRELLAETNQPPIPALPDSFWKTVTDWAKSLSAEPSSAALAEIAGASAWAGRADAATLLPLLTGTPWQDSARMRVACGWLWNGKREPAMQCAVGIKDPDWRAMTDTEMAYLTRQMAAPEAGK